MFQWLANQVRPFTTSDLIDELVPGYGARRARRIEEHDAKEARAQKKAHLHQELEDAEWILDHEKRLAELQAKIAAQR